MPETTWYVADFRSFIDVVWCMVLRGRNVKNISGGKLPENVFFWDERLIWPFDLITHIVSEVVTHYIGYHTVKKTQKVPNLHIKHKFHVSFFDYFLAQKTVSGHF